jgi:hypothetical protein
VRTPSPSRRWWPSPRDLLAPALFGGSGPFVILGNAARLPAHWLAMTNTPPLVGLIGKARVGKDTFAGFLTSEHGFQRFAFADPLRAVLLAVDPIVGMVREDRSGSCGDPGCCGGPWEDDFPLRLSEALDQFGGWEGVKALEDGPSPWTFPEVSDEVRALLQRLGTEGGRENLGADVWVNAAMARIAEHGGPAVITDVRFPNEADAIRAAGGILVRITRDDAEPIAGAAHSSETALDGYPAEWTVTNNGPREDLAGAASFLTEQVIPVRLLAQSAARNVPLVSGLGA